MTKSPASGAPLVPVPGNPPVETDDSIPQAANGLPAESDRTAPTVGLPVAEATGGDGPASVSPGPSLPTGRSTSLTPSGCCACPPTCWAPTSPTTKCPT